MQAVNYFIQSVQKLEKIYPKEEATQIMHWVFEDILLIKKKHLQFLDKEIGFAEELKLNPILERLLNGEPLQYILGYAYFRNLCLAVNKHVLIPRPETEELVEWMITEINNYYGKEYPLNILDIGTGSGCIALSLKNELKNFEVSALDVSQEALNVAKNNSVKLKLNIHFEKGSILDDTCKNWIQTQKFDVIVSNPPYITEKEKNEMHLNVLSHEPHLALFVPDEEPLLFYRHILNTFIQCESTKFLFFEISEFQETALKELCESYFLNFEFKQDLQGKTRMLMIRKIN
ncbi:MAG: peptide chain release factor N(5)-glutamine methyltransferase [Bacteroidota bacterium]|nr:peptide chain release factor N(5)-glutamine methyltransferase [Bacteroidota bacterium]